MAVKKLVMTQIANTMFKKGGRGHVILMEKVRQEENRLTCKRETNALKDCQIIFKDGMSKASCMDGQQKIDCLRQLQRRLIDRGVNPTYKKGAEKQSYVHEQIEKMAFDVAKEIVKTKR